MDSALRLKRWRLRLSEPKVDVIDQVGTKKQCDEESSQPKTNGEDEISIEDDISQLCITPFNNLEK